MKISQLHPVEVHLPRRSPPALELLGYPLSTSDKENRLYIACSACNRTHYSENLHNEFVEFIFPHPPSEENLEKLKWLESPAIPSWAFSLAEAIISLRMEVEKKHG